MNNFTWINIGQKLDKNYSFLSGFEANKVRQLLGKSWAEILYQFFTKTLPKRIHQRYTEDTPKKLHYSFINSSLRIGINQDEIGTKSVRKIVGVNWGETGAVLGQYLGSSEAKLLLQSFSKTSPEKKLIPFITDYKRKLLNLSLILLTNSFMFCRAKESI